MSLFRYFGAKLRQKAVPLLEARRRKVLTLRPLCDLCGRYLDSEQIVDSGAMFARVLGKHHGQEELASFEVPFGWDERDLAGQMRAHRWFKPETRSELESPPNNEPGLSSEVVTVPWRRH